MVHTLLLMREKCDANAELLPGLDGIENGIENGYWSWKSDSWRNVDPSRHIYNYSSLCFGYRKYKTYD